MKEIKILARIDEVDNKIQTIIKHSGFEIVKDGYSVELILETIGMLEHIKIEMLDKLKRERQLSFKKDV
jgi:hypothetical protein